MPQEKIIIKFSPEGHKDLIQALNNLKKAQDKVNSATKSVTATTKGSTAATTRATKATDDYAIRGNKLAKGNDLLSKSFATLRSRMLLFTFAMSLGGRQAIKMVKDFAKVEAMSVAFDTLSGGAGNASIALSQLGRAVGGTMSKVDLLQSANNALILGVAKSSKEMNIMFGVAVKLGRAVGRTAKDSVDSLVTGIGRQSRMMLDNIGIIMDTEKAYATYAAELGVTVESLNDTERRQAFLNATLDAAKQKADLLGDSVETLQSKLETAAASWDDLRVSSGGFMRELFGLDSKITRSAEVFDILTKAMDENQDVTQKDWLIAKDNAIAVLKLLHRITHGYNKKIQEQNFGYREQADLIKDLTDEEEIKFKQAQATQEQEIKMKKLVSETTNARLRSLDSLIDEVREGRRFFLTTKDQLDVLAMLEKQYKDLDPAEKKRIEDLKALEKQERANARAMAESEREYKRALRAVEALFPSAEKHFEQTLERIESEEHIQEVLAKTIAKLNKLGIAHDLETDATKAAREAIEEYNNAVAKATKRTDDYWGAIYKLTIAQLEQNALTDGVITNQEKLAINDERLTQAKLKLETATLAVNASNDPAIVQAQLAATNELNAAEGERVGILNSVKQVANELKIVEMERMAIEGTRSPGIISDLEQLEIVKERIKMAKEERDAVGSGDVAGQVAAQSKVNSLLQKQHKLKVEIKEASKPTDSELILGQTRRILRIEQTKEDTIRRQKEALKELGLSYTDQATGLTLINALDQQRINHLENIKVSQEELRTGVAWDAKEGQKLTEENRKDIEEQIKVNQSRLDMIDKVFQKETRNNRAIKEYEDQRKAATKLIAEHDPTPALENQLALLEATDPVQKELLKTAQEFGIENEDWEKSVEQIKLMYPELEGALQAIVDKQKELADASMSWAENVFGEDFIAGFDAAQQGWSMIANTAGMYFDSVTQGLAQEMQELKNSDEYQRKSSKGKEKMVKDLEDKQRSEKEKTWKMTKNMNLAQIAMDTAAAVMNIWKGVPMVDFGASAAILTAIAIATGAMQAGIVNSQSMPKFATGGMIGGRRHSQGGTMIEAEQGEFVMSRNAVDSVGIENLNRMNAGGGGGSVTVNVSGNVLSQDFVEGELAENIKEAIRRGTDFGIG